MTKRKRIVLVGPTASGKNHIRDIFSKKGFKSDVSYTSRTLREGEVDGKDYHFITSDDFHDRIFDGLFYEWVKYGENYYGTGRYEWDNADIFIMETAGVKSILPKDRGDCLVIYVNTPLPERVARMKARGWDNDKVYQRILIDQTNFKDFNDYDLQISSEINTLV